MKEKKHIILSLLFFAIFFIGWIGVGFYAFQQADKEKNVPVSQPSVSTSENTEILDGKEVEKKPYEQLINSAYTILGNEQTSLSDGTHVLFTDILVDTPLAESEVTALGENMFVTAKSTDKALDSIFLNVFTDKESYTASQNEDYKGEPLNGLVSSYVQDDKGENLTTYLPLPTALNKQTSLDELNYTFLDAETSSGTNGDILKVKATVEDSNESTIIDASQRLTALLKTLNEPSEQVILTLSSNQQKGTSYIYNDQYSTLLTKNTTK